MSTVCGFWCGWKAGIIHRYSPRRTACSARWHSHIVSGWMMPTITCTWATLVMPRFSTCAEWRYKHLLYTYVTFGTEGRDSWCATCPGLCMNQTTSFWPSVQRNLLICERFPLVNSTRQGHQSRHGIKSGSTLQVHLRWRVDASFTDRKRIAKFVSRAGGREIIHCIARARYVFKRRNRQTVTPNEAFVKCGLATSDDETQSFDDRMAGHEERRKKGLAEVESWIDSISVWSEYMTEMLYWP